VDFETTVWMMVALPSSAGRYGVVSKSPSTLQWWCSTHSEKPSHTGRKLQECFLLILRRATSQQDLLCWLWLVAATNNTISGAHHKGHTVRHASANFHLLQQVAALPAHLHVPHVASHTNMHVA
jgi:hypothetical protein